MAREFLGDGSDAEVFVEQHLAIEQHLTILRFSIRRPDDMFVGEVVFYNMQLGGSPPVLRRLKAGARATVVLYLPPQSFGEQTYLDATGPEVPAGADTEFRNKETKKNTDTGNTDALKNVATGADDRPDAGETRIRISGPSRLAFTMPANVESLPFTLEALLEACRSWPNARARSAAVEYTAPGPDLGGSDFAYAQAVVASDDWIESGQNYVRALNDIAPGADVATAAAGKRIANTLATSTASSAASRTAVLQQALRLETAATAAKLSALSDPKARPLLTLTIAFQAAIELSRFRPAGSIGLAVNPLTTLLAALGTPYRPGIRQTAIELPYRLIISPIAGAHFAHRVKAVERQGRHELWHTRVTGDAGNAGQDTPSKFRAIWSEDYPLANIGSVLLKPFRTPLDAQDRKMLVQLTTGFDEVTKTNAQYGPRAAHANRIILSPLGGLLDATGNWNTRPNDVDLEAWRHLMSMGRDHYVRVVYAGYLLPFGHAASLIKVTERKFEPTDSANPLSKRIALLRQRFFIVVREPLKTFDGSYHVTGGHPFPFTSVELLTTITPNLLAPDSAACKANQTGGGLYDASFGVGSGGLTPRELFWPMLTPIPTTGNFRWDVAAVDRAGQRVTFSMPLLFMSEVANKGTVTVSGAVQDRMDNVIKAYNAEGALRRGVQLGGASVCYAPMAASRDGDPRLPTQSLEFRASKASPVSDTRINTYPEVDQAQVALTAVQRILKTNATATVHYPDVYRAQGFGAGNPGELFLEFFPVGAKWDVAFGGGTQSSRTDAVGAVASPSMSIQGLSRHTGLVADVNRVINNQFDPSHYFGDAKILGGIKLTEIIAGLQPVNGGAAPKFVSRELAADGTQPARTESRYDWQTQLTGADHAGILLPNADRNKSSPFRMLAVSTVAIDAPGSPRSTVAATIGNFQINLFDFIVLWFRELTFTSEPGKKPAVNVDLHPQKAVRFGGPLEFVNGLKALLPGDGFSDPSALTVTSSGIRAHYALTVPAVQVGIFALSGLSIGAGFTLPFDTAPMEVEFNFAERENPFSLTVSLLGGGGFLAIGIGADGVREIEAALEAGAKCAIDLGVASGSVEIKAGIYFHWLEPGGGNDGLVELSGYVRLHGELDVMGLISASLTFNLQLTYDKIGKRSSIWGEATLTIEIEVLVFSGEVTVRCRREFGGSPADPKWVELMPGTSTWSNYCLAFGE